MIWAEACDASADRCFKGMLGPMGDGGEPWHGSPGQSLLQVEQHLSCTQPSQRWSGKTSGLSPCLLPDRDECEQPSVCRGQQCINTPGSYRCECKEGFAMGHRGQCEGEACCSLFPCPFNPPCARLNAFFPHRSVSRPVREEGPSHVYQPCVLPEGCLSSPLPLEGTGFPGHRGVVLSRSSPVSAGRSPHNQPMTAFHSGRRCPSIFMPP